MRHSRHRTREFRYPGCVEQHNSHDAHRRAHGRRSVPDTPPPDGRPVVDSDIYRRYRTVTFSAVVDSEIEAMGECRRDVWARRVCVEEDLT